MLGPIEKIHETTIVGSRSGYSIGTKTANPLSLLGVSAAIQTTFCAPYKLVRGDNEPHHYDLIFVLEGKLELKTSTGDFIVNPSDFVVIPSWNSRSIELIEGKQYREIYFKVFESTIQDILKLDQVKVIPAPETELLNAAFAGYKHEEGIGVDNKLSDHYLQLIAAYLKRQVLRLKKRGEVEVYNRLEELRKNIKSHPELEWSVEELAKAVHVSESHFYHLAKKRFGMTPQQMVTNERIGAAKRLLISTDMSLKEVAFKVGYSSGHGLSQAFFRITGTRPGKFRKEQK